MRAVILAGGEGTRLRPLTLTRPKAMLPLGPMPVIVHLIRHLVKIGFNELILTLSYMSEHIRAYIGDGSSLGARIEHAVEPEGIYLGTAGSVKMAAELLNGTFVVVQGDTYTNIDISEAVKTHIERGCDATIVVKRTQTPWLYGVVECDKEGFIKAFQEKPSKEECRSDKISTGI